LRAYAIMKLLLLLLLGIALAEDLIDYDRAEELKNLGVTWKVADPEKNPLRRQSLETFKRMVHGNKTAFREDKASLASILVPLEEDEIIDGDNEIPNIDKEARGDVEYDKWGIPVDFDGRKVWGKCIRSGGDQGNCNGCWAFGLANHLSDRFCVQGRDIKISVQDILECTTGNRCCQGGFASNGYKYMMNVGTVIESCKRYTKACNECKPSSCTRYKCKPNSMFWADTIQQAKREIQKNGPIQATFDVYDDFPYYGSGIYYRTSNKLLGVHTVEILGWGTEKGVNYWLCKNSWGDDWGDNGFFKIKLGDCDVNSALTTCAPLI